MTLRLLTGKNTQNRSPYLGGCFYPSFRQFNICFSLLPVGNGKIVADAGTANIQAKLERLSDEADKYLELKKQRRQAKRAAKDEQLRQQNLAYIAEKRKNRLAELKMRCEEGKITAERIKAAFDGEGQDDPHCLYSQIRSWFAGIDLETAKKCAVEGK